MNTKDNNEVSNSIRNLNALKQKWIIDCGSLMDIGEILGYDGNQVCDEIGNAEFYAQDGDGAFNVCRSNKNNYSTNKVINEIMIEIFKSYPTVNEISIINRS